MQFEDHLYYNCEITLDTGDKHLVDANWLHNEQLDKWQGWECSAGTNRLFIDSDLTIYSGECLNDRLGSIGTGWELFESLTICKRDRCTGCTDDLLQYKRKNK